LRWHLAWTVLAGAVVVAAVTALLALPLVRSVARDQARSDLARAVDTLAAAPRATAQSLVRERRALGPDDREYAVVTGSGQVLGEAASYPTPDQVATLQRTGTLSASVRRGGTDVLIEGRSLKRRDLSVIGIQPVTGVQAATDRLVRRILTALALGIVLALGLGLLISRRITGPVQAAAGRARRLAAGERGLEGTTPEHVGWAVSEVDEMVGALDALDHALATSEARQREFLLSISHELRTPLTAVRGYAEALRDGAIPAADVPAVGATLADQSDRLARFIDDLLALARLEADDFRIEHGEVDLREVIASSVAPWQAVADRAGVRLHAEPAQPLVVRGDAARIQQVLGGLLENALRVTPSGGSVVVSVRGDAEGPVIRVVDDGPGLAPGDHAHAFERGYLRDRYADDRAVGTGLGLSIAHRMSERMGGRLEAIPSDAGGTEMRLTLPPGA
jgi:two-component system sensor histidine kinase BaeS